MSSAASTRPASTRPAGAPRPAHAPLLVPQRATSLGDAAVDGLLAGLGAGAVMLVLLAVATVARGSSLTALLSALGPDPQGSPLHGLFAHVALSGMFGAGWGLIAAYGVRRTPLAPWFAGLLYGALLTLVGITLFGQNSTWLALPQPLLSVGHLFYGLLLGLNESRRQPVRAAL